MKGEANVQAGICGHNTSVQAETNDGRHVAFTIETTCDNIERFKARLATGGPVDAYREINPKASSKVLARGHEAHICTAPVARLDSEGAKVAAGLALPADADITIQKD